MTVGMYIAMGSVLIGFLLFGTAFYSYMLSKSKKVPLALVIISFLFLTVIPVVMALFWAS